MSAKDIRVAPIARKAAEALVRRVHYSGSVVLNSQLHLGVFLDGSWKASCSSAHSDKRKAQALVTGSGWNDFIELQPHGVQRPPAAQ